MAFISSCPKCQKQILVPDGTCSDAVVQCPICMGAYSMGEIYAAAPLALIVVHPGSGAFPAAVSTAASASAMNEGRVFSAHRVEPKMHDDEPLLFQGDEVQLATPDYGHAEPFGHEAAEHAAEAVMFEASPAAAQEGVQKTDHPVESLAEPFGEPLVAPLAEEGHDLAAEPADGAAPWGGAWGGFKDEAAHEGDGAVGLAEPDQDEGLEQVDFAAITGKAAPGSAPAAGPGEAAVAEPAKKKKRKREANPFVRIIGVIVCGLLAFPCAYGIAVWVNPKNDYFHLLRFVKNNKPTANNGQTPAANPNPTPANATPSGPDAGKPDQSSAATKPAGLTPAAGKQPGEEEGGTTTVEPKLGPAPNKPETPGAGKATEVAMNTPAKEETKPAAPSTAKGQDNPEPFSGTITDTKPNVAAPAKPETPAATEAEPFGPEKGKTDSKPDIKPDVATPAKPETPAMPDTEPFGPGPAPLNPKSKTDTKPDVATPAKPETPAMPDTEPFGPEKGKTDTKPDVATPAKPETPAEPEKPKPEPEPKPEPKPEVSGTLIVTNSSALPPEPKPEPKPEVSPDVKPDSKPPAGVGPLEAPSFPAADLDARLKAVSDAATVDAKTYADWCKLAEVVTYVKDGADAQKQALRTLTGKVASSPQAASAIAASAKKLFDDKATKGGIVLAGTVTGLATKNGLCGTAIRMEGMDKPVMIFSAHPLNVKETQKVIVLGALVADPAKNLPGYPGKQAVVVWADFAAAMQ